jgi:hypothetical protein
MSHNAKLTLLKLATALVVIGTISLVVLVRAAIAPAVAVVQAERRASVFVEAPPPVVVVAPAPVREPERPVVAAPVAPESPADVEARVQVQIERAVDVDPKSALTLLAEADKQFPEGKLVHERQFLRLQAMVNLDQVAEARVNATEYLERNPHSPVTRKIYRLLGIHAPPELPTR